ncbi:SH3 domain-containing protein 21 [Sorex fumeus]|uniref:SH3 domain-containing protein 21 n=1 Tax=Sorex fumeus TaxID=62283 RepID=UPI0024ACCC43|nr:SH3 domain-containing protein 21 [Sorex fumeus]
MEVLVLAGYRAQKEGELSLAPGDVVGQVCPGPARGWLRGELGGHSGLFPERLVLEIPESLRGTGEARRPRCPRRRGHLAKSWGPQRWCKVNYNYIPEQTDELELQAGEIVEVIKEIEDGWWLGKKNGQLGALPSNFVELLDSGPPSLGNADMPSIISGLEQPPKLCSLMQDSPPDYLRTACHPETYRVLFDYQPEAPDELALQKGDVVKVLRKTTEDKGWWEGESQGRRGLFPDNFVLSTPPIKKLTPRQLPRDSDPIKEVKPIKQKKMVPRAILPAVKRMGTAASPPGPSKTKLSWTPDRESTKLPTGLSGDQNHVDKKGSKSHVAAGQKGEQSSSAKAATLTKSPVPGKRGTPKRTRAAERNASPGQHLTPEKTLTPQETPAVDKKSLTADSSFPAETPDPEASVPRREGGASEVTLGHSQTSDSSSEEAKSPVATDTQSLGVPPPELLPTPTTEQPPAHPEATLKVGSSKEEAPPSGDDTYPVKLAPHPQESSTVHSPAAQSPPDGKYDNSIMKLTEEVKTLKMALELMGERMERKLGHLWEELKSEKETRQSLEVQLGLRTPKPAAPSATGEQTDAQT